MLQYLYHDRAESNKKFGICQNQPNKCLLIKRLCLKEYTRIEEIFSSIVIICWELKYYMNKYTCMT